MPTNSRFAVAVHMLVLMAGAGDKPIKSDRMAASVNTNPVVIRRILCALARAELISSQTGACGGSRLARRPSQIALSEVYRAVEGGEISTLNCHAPNRRCPVGGSMEMILDEVLTEVNTAVERALAKMTLEQIWQSIRAHKKL
ncbi:MAG TPA: Rrf2 family transcriptional regulator [Blastocatellia bacterium]|nr:Rrf2 family transcriptional regulator [Blastocatellia bacterium]